MPNPTASSSPLGLKGVRLFQKPAAERAKPDPAPAAAPAKPAVVKVASMPGDQVKVAPQALIQVPGLKAGRTLAVEQGTYQGYNFSGQAKVNAYDGKTLDLTIDAQAMFFVRAKVHLRFAMQPDGSVQFVGEQVGSRSADAQDVGTTIHIRSQKNGVTTFAGKDGQPITLAATPGGGLAIRYGEYAMTLQP